MTAELDAMLYNNSDEDNIRVDLIHTLKPIKDEILKRQKKGT